MEFNDDLGMYTFDCDGIIFGWEEEPEEDYQSQVKAIAENYKKQLPNIIEFMLPDLNDFYGTVKTEDVEEKLGKPFIDFDNGQVTYYEQSFDSIHIFSFQFLHDEFEDL
ncbi:MAG: hypothetical protein K2J55_06375, partial [Eubacterium sp.]|nr:hypothetical protein [Eubacterium sp.]